MREVLAKVNFNGIKIILYSDMTIKNSIDSNYDNIKLYISETLKPFEVSDKTFKNNNMDIYTHQFFKPTHIYDGRLILISYVGILIEDISHYDEVFIEKNINLLNSL